MNVERILAVADAIEQHTIPWLGFNMSNYKAVDLVDHTGHDCGTTACIAGWANAIRLSLKATEPARAGWSEHDGAADWLGIYEDNWPSDSISDQLFYARNHPDYQASDTKTCWDKISADQAVRTLRHLAATGNVDWTV